MDIRTALAYVHVYFCDGGSYRYSETRGGVIRSGVAAPGLDGVGRLLQFSFSHALSVDQCQIREYQRTWAAGQDCIGKESERLGACLLGLRRLMGNPHNAAFFIKTNRSPKRTTYCKLCTVYDRKSLHNILLRHTHCTPCLSLPFITDKGKQEFLSESDRSWTVAEHSNVTSK